MPLIVIVYWIGAIAVTIISITIGFYLALDEASEGDYLEIAGYSLLAACGAIVAGLAWPASIFFGPTYLFWKHQQGKKRIRSSF